MMKNSEWAIVAYMTNAIGRIPYSNTNSREGFVTGKIGSSAWNSANGVKGSTTHNVYGIYDMIGDKEYVDFRDSYSGDMSNVIANWYANSNNEYYVIIEIMLKRVYGYGRALNEVLIVTDGGTNSSDRITAWDANGQYNEFFTETYLDTGGGIDMYRGNLNSIFSFGSDDCTGSYNDEGFRVVLEPAY